MPNKAILVQAHGGPEVLISADYREPPTPGPGIVTIRHTAIGVNYLDTYYRSGMYKLNNFPFIPGVEAVGVVEARGPDVELPIGTRVAYAVATAGAYSLRRNIELAKLVPVPAPISDQMAAASLHKGMIAHMLVFRVYKLNKNNTILLHNATDGVGQILCQWAKYLGATIIGTVNSPDKVAIATRNGCDYVANYKDAKATLDLVKNVTKGHGVSVVYDSVGKDTYALSVQALMPMGIYISYDQSSGMIPGINMLSLAGKSLYMTRPSVHMYKNHIIEMVLTANEVFDKIQKGSLTPTIGAVYNFDEAAKAHQDLLEQRTSGSIILKV